MGQIRRQPDGCNTTRRTTHLCGIDWAPVNEQLIYTHSNCACNERLALLNRHLHNPVKHIGELLSNQLITRDVPLSNYVKRFQVAVDDWIAWTKTEMPHTECMTRRQVVNLYSGAKRKEYEAGLISLDKNGITKKDTFISMFLKDDKYACNPYDLRLKAPRCIQYRSKAYCIMFGKYTHAMEGPIYARKDQWDTYIIAKSRNTHQRAQDLHAKFSLGWKYVYLLDHSNFDAHVNVALIKSIHRIYESIFPNDKTLDFLLSQHYRNVGYSKRGAKYVVEGTRMSGEMDTGLANSLLNHCLLKAIFGDQASYYLDGDDSVVFSNELIDCVPQKFFELGMETKCQLLVSPEMEDLDFCQSKPVFDGHSWRMVREPVRAMTRLGWITKRRDKAFMGRLVYSIGKCELSLGNGIPIFQAVAEKLISAGTPKFTKETDRYLAAKLEYYGPERAQRYDIRPETRDSFFKAFGITPAEQIAVENAKLIRRSPPCEFDLEQYFVEIRANEGLPDVIR